MNAAGHCKIDIAKQLKRSEDTVRRCLRNWEAGQRLQSKAGSGRPHKTSKQDDRKIFLEVKRDPFISAREILARNPSLSISEKTVKRRLVQCGGYGSYWAACKPYLTKEHKKKRLEWAREHVGWTKDQWAKVLFSDESPFTLRWQSRRRVWRLPNERYNPKKMRATVEHDVKINVWGGFCASGKTALSKIEGNMNAEQYIEILQDTMYPSARALFRDGNFIFQQDNDPKHTARATKEWFRWTRTKVLAWPAQSPDMNPIENLWSILNNRAKERVSSSENELFNDLQEAWNNLPIDQLQKLVATMPACCQAVIDAKGSATRY
jgi:hypothetical protein